MKAARKFTYQQRDSATVKARANQRGSEFDSLYKDGIKIYKVKEGKNKVRILPPTWDSASHFGYDVYINYGIGINEQAYLSLSEMQGKPDPLAEARKKAERSGDRDLADSLKPTKRVAYFLIDRMDEDEGPQLWIAPWTIDRSLCALSTDEETGESLMLDNPEDGNDIVFYKEGSGLGTKYPAEKMRIMKPSRLSEDEGLEEEWLDFITQNPIPECLNFYDYDHIAAAFDGYVSNDKGKANGKANSKEGNGKAVKDEDDDGSVPPRATAKPTKAPTKAKIPEPEEDDEYDPETGEVIDDNPLPDGDDVVVEVKSKPLDKIRDRLKGRARA